MIRITTTSSPARTLSQSFFGGFYTAICVNASTLNEDWGRDESYVGVRVYNAATGQQVDKVETNRITG